MNDTATGSPIRSLRPTPGVRLRWRGVIRSELIKLLGLRHTGWCLLLAIITSGLIALTTAAGAQPASVIEYDASIMRMDQASALTGGSQFTYLIVAVVSVLAMTGEFASGSIRSTLSAVPSRTPVLIGKAFAVMLFGAATGLTCIAASLVVTAPVFAGKGHALAYLDPYVYTSAIKSVVFLVLTALVALAFGTLARSNVLGLALTFTLMQMAPLICGVIGGRLGSNLAWNMTWFFPAYPAGAAFFGSESFAEQFDAGGHLQLSAIQGLSVLLIWLTITGTFATVSFRRRPIR